MFEYRPAEHHFRATPSRVSSASVNAWVGVLSEESDAELAPDPDTELIDRIRALEELKAAASAAQARTAAAFDASQRRKQALEGVPRDRQGWGVASQIALARRESANRGGRLLGFAKALTQDMPCTLYALSHGKISEWRATLLVRETACLSREDRQRVDVEVAGDPELLETLGDRQLISRARGASYRLDPQAAVNRAAKAASERFVSCRPAPDTMTYLTGLLPVAQGVGVYAALSREADRLTAAGDGRTRGQIMADTLVGRITGQTQADAMKVEVQLVMTDRTLLAGESEPAFVPGYGPVPAQWARDLVRNRDRAKGVREEGNRKGKGESRFKGNAGRDADGTAAAPGIDRDDSIEKGGRNSVGGSAGGDAPPGGTNGGRRRGRSERPAKEAQTFVRRLYTAPETGELVAMDARARLFPTSLARFIAARDSTCRMPWCGAPIREFDHVRRHSDGGPTSIGNGQGLCEACNHAKEAPGWSAKVIKPPGAPALPAHTVETSTPTGHRYRSTAPPLAGAPVEAGLSAVERIVADLIRAA
ncbi:HNH endonuclease [Arthrobacter sp. zg-Y179]|uniref:HNH endonuclease n=1 Tax=Arthrobacter sp. zg-Y179 TaxID=2894188 RepID=UPI001E367487|nr:HNH endonuclease signature motif containing protein [Arthrobacter sp. zg-Y179]MCC9174791.1 HNH endonuclease [Arthrobacter sp. zg-Y179]